jgi:hypothetical protein
VRLSSRGLGRKELVMDFREYDVVREGREIIIKGVIREPVRWDFAIRMCEDDLAGLVKVAARRSTIGFVLRSALRRKKQHHWSGDRDEHVKSAREAGKVLSEKIRAQEKEHKKKVAADAKSAEEAVRAATEQANGQGATAESDLDEPIDLEAAEA